MNSFTSMIQHALMQGPVSMSASAPMRFKVMGTTTHILRQILLLHSFKEKNRLSKIVRTCTQKNLPKHPHFQIPNGGLVMGGYSEGR